MTNVELGVANPNSVLLGLVLWVPGAIHPAVAQSIPPLSGLAMILGGNEENARPFRECFFEGVRQVGQVGGRTA